MLPTPPRPRILPILGLLCFASCQDPPPPRSVEIPEPLLTATADEAVAREHSTGARAVVLAVLDTLRADYLGSYGSERGLTPHLDALAEQSVRFERAYATSAWTRSSIASMLTARYPTALGVLRRADVLPESALTLPEILSAQGFATHGISTNVNAGADVGFGQGFDSFVVPPGRASYPGDFEMIPAEAVTAAALEWIDGRKDDPRPLFLFVHYTDPHDPYLPRPEWNDPGLAGGRFDGSRRSLQELDSTPREELTPQDLNRIVDLYCGEVAYCDRFVGALLGGLESRGLDAENTLLIVTSDHGEGLWSHGWRGHGIDLYEEMIRVPLLMRGPELSGTAIETPVSLIDLSPTVLAHLGLPRPDELQGHSWLPLLRGENRPPALEVIYSELTLGPFDLESLSLGSLKLIKNRGLINEPQSPYQLYDLAADPAEQVDLIGKGHPWEQPLIDALWKWNRAIAATATMAEPGRLTELSEDTIAAMKGLGYLGPK